MADGAMPRISASRVALLITSEVAKWAPVIKAANITSSP